MKDYLTSRTFQSLTITDLLGARNRHHIRLSTQYPNIVGTALGFFRYRITDDSSRDFQAAEKRMNLRFKNLSKDSRETISGPRTIENSVAREWSPPCILIFVDRWLSREEFRSDPGKIIPSFLETDDARLVPTCIILATKDEAAPDVSDHLNFPSHLFGGGFAVSAEVQGREHVSSVACLVTDGDRTYALTNRHVVGTEPGRILSTYVNDLPRRVGASSGVSVGKVPSARVYSKWPGQEAYSNVDAGLIIVDDVNHWTTQVFGIGRLDEPLRINFDSALETCIGLKVKAFGSASGPLYGEIVAIFYRYKALGGYDFISDFLIGARPGFADYLRTLPGDSGTLWVIDPVSEPPKQTPVRNSLTDNDERQVADDEEAVVRKPADWFCPVALQWGGQVILSGDGKQKFNFALATSVESACRLLEVDVLRDWNVGHPEYWGEMGHYTIGLKACKLISDASPKLVALMRRNSKSVGFDLTILRDPNQYHKKKAGYKNVPLADVPDNVWRNPTQYGGRSGLRNHPEKNNDGNNHFADMDQPGVGKYANKTLMKLYEDDPASLNIDTWDEFYDLLNAAGIDISPGALPFRIWQGFNEMVSYLQKKDLVSYLCVAGTMAHYVGDACQPLHISRLHHGDPDHPASVNKRVHEIYETLMLDLHASAVLNGLKTRLADPAAKAKPVFATGQQAANGVVNLMINTYTRLKPQRIIDIYSQGHNDEDRANKLWTNCKEQTLDNMAECCSYLASIWESAWKVAGAEAVTDESAVRKFDYDTEIHPAYRPQSFYPSVALSLMKPFCT